MDAEERILAALDFFKRLVFEKMTPPLSQDQRDYIENSLAMVRAEVIRRLERAT